MIRKLLVVGVVALLATAVYAARPGVVTTKDGTVYEGQIEEREGSLVVNIRGIETTIPRENVASVKYGTFAEQYEKERQSLGANDSAGRVTLAKKALAAGEYDLALSTIEEALAIDPNSADATDLQRAVIAQRRVKQGSGAATTPKAAGPSTTATTGPASAPTATHGPWKVLSADDINRIRQVELRDEDPRVTIQFANNVVKKYADTNPDVKYQEFRKMTPLKQAIEIIDKGGDLAKDVKIASDPAPLREWQAKVQPIVLAGCATSGCHGGANAIAPMLISPATDTSASYTNFYVLQSYSRKSKEAPKPGAMFGGGDGLMINRDNPDQSLLLTYGLANAPAGSKHPTVKNYNGVFMKGKEDAKYELITKWISDMLRRVQPDYQLKFTPGRTEAKGT